MKKLLSKSFDFFLGCLALVLMLLSLPFVLLSIPGKYITYRRSHFFRDTGAGFKLWSVDSETFQIYELLQKHGLPIRYLLPADQKRKDDGWFLAGSTLLVHNLEGLFYEPTLGGWTAYPEDEEPLSVTLEDIRTQLLTDHPEVTVTDIRVLADFTEASAEEYRLARSDPSLLTYSGREQLLEILRKF